MRFGLESQTARSALTFLCAIANFAIGVWCIVDPMTPFAVPMGYVNLGAGVALLGYGLWDL